MRMAALCACLAIGWMTLSGCRDAEEGTAAKTQEARAGTAQQEVVVYTALDQMFSEPLLQRFERETGIRVRAVYDTEAAKTVGLVNRLLAEAKRPQCDVFWNNEILRTLLLKRQGLTEAYLSPQAESLPAFARDPEGHWTGFAARARVIIYNKNLVGEGEIPRRLEDLADARWSGRCAVANPLFGTTSTQAAMQWGVWGPERTQDFFRRLKGNGVAVLAGNATVRDRVALGELAWGLTDSDDAQGALLDGRPVGVTLPEFDDPATGGRGILMIPNSVCLVRGAPHPEAARRLIDFLLSEEVERALSESRSAQFPLREGMAPPKGWEEAASHKMLEVEWGRVLDALAPSAQWLNQEFVP